MKIQAGVPDERFECRMGQQLDPMAGGLQADS
jgi:hypothetical protein